MSQTNHTISIHKTQNSRLNEFDPNNLKFGHVFSDHMFIADYKDGKWQDLRVVPYANFEMSPANSMMHYGQSIFEGLKAFKSKNGNVLVFRPEENAKRFIKSSQRMCMAELPETIFMEGLKALLNIDYDWIPDTPGSSMYIRPFMIATDNFLGVRPSESYRFMIIASPSGSYYSEPVKVKIEDYFVRAASGGTGTAKTAGNYAAALYPAKKAQEAGFHQLIWTDAKEHKYIEESGTMNVFFLFKDNTLITSPLGDSILDGVTRKSVVQIAKDWGLNMQERPVLVSEIVEGLRNGTLIDAFGAGTAATIAHIAQIGYKNEMFTLPEVQNREFSNKLRNYLEDLKRGNREDNYNWNWVLTK